MSIELTRFNSRNGQPKRYLDPTLQWWKHRLMGDLLRSPKLVNEEREYSLPSAMLHPTHEDSPGGWVFLDLWLLLIFYICDEV